MCRLRDDSRQASAVLQHLAKETQHAYEVTKSFEGLQLDFERDIAGRVPDIEYLPAVRKGEFWYYQCRQDGDQYWRLLRKPASSDLAEGCPGAPVKPFTCVVHNSRCTRNRRRCDAQDSLAFASWIPISSSTATGMLGAGTSQPVGRS
jgi:hypothetical protein